MVNFGNVGSTLDIFNLDSELLTEETRFAKAMPEERAKG